MMVVLGIVCLGFSFGGFLGFGTNQVYAQDGGAVYLKTGAKYTMGGGLIKGKTADNGGAVYISNSATFTMNGGTISGNTATKGSGVYIASGGTFNMNGGTMADDVYAIGSMVYGGGTVSGNITLDGAEKLTINKKPTTALKITALTTTVGTKLAKVNASDFVISDIVVSGLPAGRSVILSGGYVVVDNTYYTVTITSSNSAYGTVSKTSLTVAYGTSISASGSTLTVGSNTITATPTTDTAQYDYSFTGWTGASGTVTGNKTITANFSRSVNKYTVTLSGGSGYGSWDNTSSITANYGTSISVSGNKVTVGSTTRTWTTSSDTAQYDYTFNSLELSRTGTSITGNTTITPNVSRVIKTYTVTWKNYDGTVLETDTGVAYGTTPTYDGNTPTKWMDAQYSYTFSGWSPSVGSITGDTTYTAQYSSALRKYTVTIAVNNSNYGSVSKTSVASVPYGATIKVGSSANILNVNGTNVTATANSATEGASYSFSKWTQTSTTGTQITTTGITVTGLVTIYANFTQTLKQYTINIVVDGEGYLENIPGDYLGGSYSITVPYGTAWSIDSDSLTIGEETFYVFADGSGEFDGWSWSGTSGTILSSDTIYAYIKSSSSYIPVYIENGTPELGGYYIITLNGEFVSEIYVEYGTEIVVSGNYLYIGDYEVEACYDYGAVFGLWDIPENYVYSEMFIYMQFTPDPSTMQRVTITGNYDEGEFYVMEGATIYFHANGEVYWETYSGYSEYMLTIAPTGGEDYIYANNGIEYKSGSFGDGYEVMFRFQIYEDTTIEYTCDTYYG